MNGCILKTSTLMKSLNVPVRHLQVSSRLQEKGFLSSFFERKVEVQQQAHSDKFAKKERISEIQSHNVKPDSIDKYLKAQENLIGNILILLSVACILFKVLSMQIKMCYMGNAWGTLVFLLVIKINLFTFGDMMVDTMQSTKTSNFWKIVKTTDLS